MREVGREALHLDMTDDSAAQLENGGAAVATP